VSARLALACLLSGWLFVGCTFDDNRRHCESDRQCDSAMSRCYQGFCVRKQSSRMDAAVGGSSGAGEGGSDASAGAGGQGGSNTGGMGGRPSADTGVGGDCEGDATRDCNAPWDQAALLGGCGEGTQACVDGEWGVCAPKRMMIGAEECNNLDDDCDGETDEESDVACFPNGASGCMPAPEGGFDCFAPCKVGMQRCVDGNLQACAGASVGAPKDDCSTEQVDENCDGAPNDGCMCTTNATRTCYTGMPANTQGRGICRAGEQRCENGVWGAICQGAVVPRTETCNGLDDDCNGNVDENPTGIGAPCTTGMDGICEAGTRQCPSGSTSLVCVRTMSPGTETCNGADDNCDGMTDNVPVEDLRTNNMHCGMCGVACTGGQVCCGGMCVPTNTNTHCGSCNACPMGQMCMAGSPSMCVPIPDAGQMCGSNPPCASNQVCCNGMCMMEDIANCGMCNQACPAAAPAPGGAVAPGCCNGECIDLSVSGNCGGCGIVCAAPGGSAPCMCATTGTTPPYACLNDPQACP
jgi:hypothetical protein